MVNVNTKPVLLWKEGVVSCREHRRWGIVHSDPCPLKPPNNAKVFYKVHVQHIRYIPVQVVCVTMLKMCTDERRASANFELSCFCSK